MLKIDLFQHILPVKYKEALYKVAPPKFYLKDVIESLPTLFDLDHRFRIMDKFDGLMQVLTIAQPPLENFVLGQTAIDRIDAPAGLSIGALGPAEIALSIAAGMVKALRS